MLRVKAVFPLDCGRTGGEADLMGGAKHGAGMSTQILQLYPHTGTTRALNGTYLAHELHALGTSEQPFVYANFVSSLDGRIAVVEAHTGESYVLEDLRAVTTGGCSRSCRRKPTAWSRTAATGMEASSGRSRHPKALDA
jgi:hypothetical protein